MFTNQEYKSVQVRAYTIWQICKRSSSASIVYTQLCTLWYSQFFLHFFPPFYKKATDVVFQYLFSNVVILNRHNAKRSTTSNRQHYIYNRF